jgi:hypothetical protein
MSDYASSPYKQFNKAFKEMLKDLKRTFPNMNEMKLVYAGYKVVKSLDKKMVNELWREMFETPYRDYIKRHDDSFFTSPDYKLPEGLSPMYAAVIPTIIETWKHLDDPNKAAIWAHIDVLMTLSERI